MQTYKITIQPTSAFGTPLQGDTMFGQFCWGIVHLFGEEKLMQLLDGYTDNRPFAVFSDAFPAEYLPLPTLPSFLFDKNEEDQKQLKKLKWIKINDCSSPTSQWQKKAWENKNDPMLINQFKEQDQSHNTIDRLVGSTTAGGQFVPYQSSQKWFYPDHLLNIYLVLNEQCLSLSGCKDILKNIGKFGFGRDASIGLGQFNLLDIKAFDYTTLDSANCYMTLANSAPQSVNWDKDRCYYQITTRFGRHGDRYALDENPFKKPIILAKAGAILTPKNMPTVYELFIGNGLNSISYIKDEIVHQGYAPVIPLRVKFK